jgi:phosphatidylglycerol:prolipoprotein diacylglycerol transferase
VLVWEYAGPTVKPIPVQFHIGPLVLHTYGIGLAVTFWLAFRYYERRLKAAGYPTQWLPGVFAWVVVTAIAGARIVHVLANWSFYAAQPGQILAVWHGGLSSFGGLLFAIPTGTYLARRRCPDLSGLQALDLVAPVLVLSWAIGRLLGPQLMVAGGGRRTTAWYGMAYAGQVGNRVPVPLIQAFDCLVIYAVVILVERHYAARPTGFLIATSATLYGAARFFEESVFLRRNDHVGSLLVEAAGIGLVVAGAAWMLYLARRGRRLAAPGNTVGAGSRGSPEGDSPEGDSPDPSGGLEPAPETGTTDLAPAGAIAPAGPGEDAAAPPDTVSG